ncbi:uncharacterized protein CLAFUR5_06694 [Fulvia fulva]|uniref:TM7S3/TM198-like domain-containing protein n=1 Tax=Passalora fulva TaxID=5499 RepID=A0A9Q8PBH7_PASFU|nr:uncharacterized protein CLAFUR5_06694 [Fulvia fulva]UJO19428.1 hypothetical protein CLAFUR5_06694 [Fulvia fulva]
MRFQYALVTFLFALSSAERIAGRHGLQIRQDNNDAATTSDAPASSTNSEDNPSSSPAPTDPASTTNSDQDQGSRTASRTGDEASPITRTGTVVDVPTTTPSILPGDKNATAENPLPIEPKINPPLGIAGAFLMIAGPILGFVGIKRRGVQTFLSTALLVALSIEVLIVYLMKPPVPVAIQGAYLVAGVVGGILVAGASLIFKEVSEGFGCVLGGFCFAMWLLVLAPGGTIKSSVGKIILIAIFCVVSYCLYISRFTRVYGIIISTALAGSTAFVLGLDCFTRAGLKEFWLYIWNLNDDVFPIFTDTYPITRPIRAEVAAIIIIAFLGSMSQIKIWKVVKERRQERAAQRIQDEEARDAREEDVGRRVETENKDALAQWEHDYDGKKMPSVEIHDSGIGSIDEDYNSTTTSHKRCSYPLVQVRTAASEPNMSTSNLLPQSKLATVPSLPELSFFDAPYYDETTGKTTYASAKGSQAASEPSTPGTPSLDVPNSSIKDRRSVAVKRLSLQSLQEKAAMEAVEDKKAKRAKGGDTPQITEEEEEEEDVPPPPPSGSDLASSTGATAPDGKSDKLSVQLDFDIYKQWDPAPSPEIQIEEQAIFEEEDNDALGPRRRRSMLSILSSSGRRQSSSSRRLRDGPATPEIEKSENGMTAGAAQPDQDLIDRLQQKSSRPVRKHRIKEWAMEVSRAEPEPIEELEMDDPECVRVEAGDASQAARAAENNAAPAPPSPPTPPPPTPPPPPEPKPVVAKPSKLSTYTERTSVAMPTPIYSHKSTASDDSWSVPLGKRSSSAQLLRTEPGSTPLDVMRNVSAPILEQPLVTSPASSPERAPSRDNRLSTLPSLPNLMDERRERLDKRLTSTSFMRPSTSLGINTPPKTLSHDSKDGSREGSLQSGKISASMDSTHIDDEDMTLAERKAFVQRQSQLQLQNAEIAARPLNSRHASGYGFPQVTPPRPVRISSQGGMQPLYDSHQPKRQSSHDVNKQAQNWNQWRASQQVANNYRNPYMVNDNQQDMLRAMRLQSVHEVKRQEHEKQVIQEQMDTHARMGGINDAHARALAKMQSKANKNMQ